MGVNINRKTFLITAKLKTFYFDLPKDDEKNLKQENDFIIKHNNIIAEHTVKNEISKLLSKYKHENHVHEHRNLV